jgi:hypothetical protein
MSIRRLVLVYAVDGGVFNAAVDFAHKLLSPSTYPCALCALTYGPLGEHKAWTRFVANLPVPTAFLHRDEFTKEYPEIRTELPAIFVERDHRDANLEPFVSAPELRSAKDVHQLIELVEQKLKVAAPLLHSVG